MAIAQTPTKAGANLKVSFLLKVEELANRKASTLDELKQLSNGGINAIIVWRTDGDVDFYIPDERKVKAGGGSTNLVSPKKSMKDHGLPASDIILINGTPKIASINGTLYEIEDNLSMPGSEAPNPN